MEYIIIGIIVLIAFILMLLMIKVDKFREKANALFLEAEKNITEEKLEYVSNNLYSYLPAFLKLFLNIDSFTTIVQKLYDKTRLIAKDILADGKYDGKEN